MCIYCSFLFCLWMFYMFFFFFSSRRRHTRCGRDWSSDVCSSDLDGEGCISILNRSAEQLVGHSEADVLGRPLTEIVPELADLFANARAGLQRLVQGQV